jgi:single-strand DNA-binding protein
LAASNRRYDRSKKAWVDGETNWFTITSFRQLAINSASSISKGDRVVATGRLKVRDWDNGERTGTSVEIEANSLGPDLSWGTAEFTRTSLVREDPEGQDLEDDEIDSESELVGALGS